MIRERSRSASSQRVEREGVAVGAGRAEEVRLRPRRQHDRVAGPGLAVGRRDRARRRVDRRDLDQLHVDVRVIAEELAQRDRRCSLAVELGGRDLVQQRLELVVVVAVEQRDAHVVVLRELAARSRARRSPRRRRSRGAVDPRRSRQARFAALRAHPLEQVVADAQRVGHRGQRRVDRSDAREEARVDHVEVVELVGPAVHVQHGCPGVGAEAAGAGLVRHPCDRDGGLEVGMTWNQVVGLHPGVLEQPLQLVVKLLHGLLVRRGVADPHVPVTVQRDAILRSRQVLRREPEVDRMAGHALERALRRELGLERLLAAVHVGRRLADHLDVAERIFEVVAAEVEVVQPEGLLKDGRVLFLGESQHGLAVVEGVVAPELVGAVGQAVRVLVVGRGEQQLGRVRRAARDHHDVGGVRLALALAFDLDLGHGGAGRIGPERECPRVRQQRHVRVLERRPHSEHLCVGLGVHQAREAVAGGAAHAVAVRHVRLVQHHPAGGVKRMVPRGGEVVRELLDPGLVRDRREWVGSARRRLRRVLAPRPVHLVELLGQRVVGLHLVVADRPRRRYAVVVLELAEVLLAQAVERRAVELRRAADEVVHLRLECL